MRLRFVSFVFLVIVWSLSASSATDCPGQIGAKAAQVFGPPLSVDHCVFRLDDTYVIWLITDTKGNLLEADVGPRSYYTTEFPVARKTTNSEHLSDAEYREALRRISGLKDAGALQETHGSAVPSDFGPFNTDRFERAFVDRVVEADDAESVRKFNIYFLQDLEGSPEQVLTTGAQPMVCLVSLWYYVPPEEARRIQLGTWQKLRAAGPNLHGTTGCFRTMVLHDADGFTIEEPQNETVVLADIHVRALAGRVDGMGAALEGANVEVERIGSKEVLRIKTNATGSFGFADLPEGKYKFKVTKDGFKALSGIVFVDRNATKERLSFELHVGT